MVAARGSVVGSPLASRANPAASVSPLRRACASLPIEITPEPISTARGSSSPGTAIESGAVETPAARAPWYAMFGTEAVMAIIAIPFRAPSCV